MVPDEKSGLSHQILKYVNLMIHTCLQLMIRHACKLVQTRCPKGSLLFLDLPGEVGFAVPLGPEDSTKGPNSSRRDDKEVTMWSWVLPPRGCYD